MIRMATKIILRAYIMFRSGYLTLAPLVLTLLTAVACNRDHVQAAAPAMPAPLVAVLRATAHDGPRYLDENSRLGVSQVRSEFGLSWNGVP